MATADYTQTDTAAMSRLRAFGIDDINPPPPPLFCHHTVQRSNASSSRGINVPGVQTEERKPLQNESHPL